MDLRDAVAYHQLVLGAEGRSQHTQRNYLYYERLLIDGMEALGLPLRLETINAATARMVLDWYRGRVKEGTRGGVVGVKQFAERIIIFTHFLENEELLPEGTLRRFRAPRVTKVLREPFTQSEVAAMWGATRRTRTPERDEAVFLLLLDTGMRIGEVAGLTLDRLRIDQRQVIAGAAGKSRRERIVPFGDSSKRDGGRTARALRAWLDVRQDGRYSDNRVFLSYDGRPILSQGLSDSVQRLGALGGVNNPIPHRLRHTFCTWYLVMFPGDEIGLRRVVGHLSHEVLADYVHFAQSIIAERAGRASLSESWLGTTARAPTAALVRRTTAGAPAVNERPQREAGPRSSRITGTTSMTNGVALSNVSGFRLHTDEAVEPFAF